LTLKIDTRAGSKELIAPLRRLGVPVEEATLPAGDVEVMGNGPDGRLVPVGCEYKKLPDAFQCLRDGRFAEQLRGMREGYEVCWLLLEGRFQKDKYGHLQVFAKNRWQKAHGGINYQEFAAWLMTMVMRGGVLIHHTEDQYETVEWLRTFHLWWTKKEYADHRAHLANYTPEILGGVTPFERPTAVQLAASALPGVGPARSVALAKRFKSVRELACATEEELLECEGIGKKGAKKLLGVLNE